MPSYPASCVYELQKACGGRITLLRSVQSEWDLHALYEMKIGISFIRAHSRCLFQQHVWYVKGGLISWETNHAVDSMREFFMNSQGPLFDTEYVLTQRCIGAENDNNQQLAFQPWEIMCCALLVSFRPQWAVVSPNGWCFRTGTICLILEIRGRIQWVPSSPDLWPQSQEWCYREQYSGVESVLSWILRVNDNSSFSMDWPGPSKSLQDMGTSFS